MPNWVLAKLTIYGPKSNKVMKDLLTEDEDSESGVRFDFNKIIPMPESMKIISGSVTQNCMKLFLDHITENQNEAPNYLMAYEKTNNSPFTRLGDSQRKELMESCLSHIEFETKEKTFASKQSVYDYGKKALDNVIKYGYLDWYEWSYAHWGTKWNACHTQYDESKPNEIYFETAWSDVRQLIFELSKMYPDNVFNYEYAEEFIGNYTGSAEFQNGEIIRDLEYEHYSKDAYDIAFKLWGEGLRENYKFDEETKTYKYIDDQDEEDGGLE